MILASHSLNHHDGLAADLETISSRADHLSTTLRDLIAAVERETTFFAREYGVVFPLPLALNDAAFAIRWLTDSHEAVRRNPNDPTSLEALRELTEVVAPIHEQLLSNYRDAIAEASTKNDHTLPSALLRTAPWVSTQAKLGGAFLDVVNVDFSRPSPEEAPPIIEGNPDEEDVDVEEEVVFEEWDTANDDLSTQFALDALSDEDLLKGLYSLTVNMPEKPFYKKILLGICGLLYAATAMENLPMETPKEREELRAVGLGLYGFLLNDLNPEANAEHVNRLANRARALFSTLQARLSKPITTLPQILLKSSLPRRHERLHVESPPTLRKPHIVPDRFLPEDIALTDTSSVVLKRRSAFQLEAHLMGLNHSLGRLEEEKRRLEFKIEKEKGLWKRLTFRRDTSLIQGLEADLKRNERDRGNAQEEIGREQELLKEAIELERIKPPPVMRTVPSRPAVTVPSRPIPAVRQERQTFLRAMLTIRPFLTSNPSPHPLIQAEFDKLLLDHERLNRAIVTTDPSLFSDLMASYERMKHAATALATLGDSSADKNDASSLWDDLQAIRRGLLMIENSTTDFGDSRLDSVDYSTRRRQEHMTGALELRTSSTSADRNRYFAHERLAKLQHLKQRFSNPSSLPASSVRQLLMAFRLYQDTLLRLDGLSLYLDASASPVSNAKATTDALLSRFVDDGQFLDKTVNLALNEPLSTQTTQHVQFFNNKMSQLQEGIQRLTRSLHEPLVSQEQTRAQRLKEARSPRGRVLDWFKREVLNQSVPSPLRLDGEHRASVHELRTARTTYGESMRRAFEAGTAEAMPLAA